VFVQPLLTTAEAGVAFFDGFYYERTQTRGSNEGLTSGQARGEVQRGHLMREEPWSEWLASVHAVFGNRRQGDTALDIEYARDDAGYVLLQVRPALFPVARNPILSLANHKETLGDRPSPWVVSALVEAGQDLSFLAQADPAIARWGEAYAIEAAERAWLNVSFWYRWMDHFGLPRTFVTEGVGGSADSPADRHLLPGRCLRSLPRLLWFQLCCLRVLPGLPRALRSLDEALAAARRLDELYVVTVQALALALRGNFAINAVLSGVSRVRRALRLPTSGRVVTRDMMEAYHRLATLPAEEREAALDHWLQCYGHRGPLESDLARPRFAEVRAVLLQDLQRAASGPPAQAPPPQATGRHWSFLYRIDERREWFRDQLMRRWQRLRREILEEAQRLTAAGELEATEDVFWLRGSDLRVRSKQTGGSLRDLVAAARARAETIRQVELPLSAPQETILAALKRAKLEQAHEAGRQVFPGIALSSQVVEGRVHKADDLLTLLSEDCPERHVLSPETILLVPTLEPSWAVVFPRVGGVVAELGGELSHASILLREAGRPAIVNCTGAFHHFQTGDQIRLDGERCLVERIG
jgi:pyruvate,water dikinase